MKIKTNKVEENTVEESEDEIDSDAELQEALAKKLIKPGLNIEINPEKKYINNQESMKRKLKDIYLNMDWVERMDVTVKKAAIQSDVENSSEMVDNDFKREHTFFQQAQSAVLEGLKKLHDLGVSTKRPDDYYAEMAKSDEHMKKVKEVLLSKEAELEKREKIRKLRELKKMSKQMQVENLKKRNQEKKKFNKSIEDIKKGKSKDTAVLDGKDKSKRNTENGNKNKKDITKNKKRKFKDTKYGFGGRKKRSKYNTAESSSSFSDYNPKLNGNKSRKFKNKNKPKKMKK